MQNSATSKLKDILYVYTFICKNFHSDAFFFSKISTAKWLCESHNYGTLINIFIISRECIEVIKIAQV